MRVEHPAAVTFHERLWPPAWLWVVITVFVVTVGIALGVPLGLPAGIATFVVLEGLSAWVLLRAASVVEVSSHELRAGRARLPLRFVGSVTPLDAAAAATLRGTGADARAYLLIRSWVPTAVRVDVTDHADPTPYWYVTTARPAALARALSEARPEDQVQNDAPPSDRAG